jgi:hypothetical protein
MKLLILVKVVGTSEDPDRHLAIVLYKEGVVFRAMVHLRQPHEGKYRHDRVRGRCIYELVCS